MNRVTSKSLKALVFASAVFLGACQNSPIRNPLAGYKEPGLGPLPQMATHIEQVDTQVMWTQNLADHIGVAKLVPLVKGQTVFVADPIGRVKAVDRQTGQERWQQNTGLKFSAGPSIVDGKLILGTKDAQIVVYDVDNGMQLWKQPLSSAMLAPAAGAQNLIVVKTVDGGIQALDNRDGTTVWRVEHSMPALTLRYHSAPKVVNDSVIVGLASGKCLSLNLHNGYTQWERSITVPRGRSELQRMVDISADPIVRNNTVYVVAYQGKLAALNLETGAVKWEKELSAFQDIASDNKALYLTDTNFDVWAIEQATGIVMWKQKDLQKRRVTAPAVINNQLVVADKDGYLHWLNKSDGKLLGYSRTESKIRVAPISQDNQLFVRTQKGKLAAIHVREKG